MAAEDEGRTEEPSEYRLEKARKEGRVPKSQEVSGALVLLMTVFLLIFLGRWILEQCTAIFNYYFSRCSNPDLSDKNMITAFLFFLLRIILPVAAVSAVSAFVGNIIQTRGVVFSLKPIQPDFSRILPHFGNYLKKTIFSFTGLFNFVKSIIKVALIVFVAYFLIKREIPDFIMIISNGLILESLSRIAVLCAKLMIIVAVLFLAISIPDYFVQKRDFMESQKMTKQEVKQEFKELEGDPEVKNRLKQAQQQLLQQNLRKTVSEADVVIANPTHYAVSLKYDQAVTDIPVVTAKGEDAQALLIRHIAEENDVPVVENRPVARELYTNVEVGDIIPETYYKAIALIYAEIGFK